MEQVGSGNYTYEIIRDFPRLPPGEKFGVISRVATDSKDNLYVFQRKDPPIMVFDREGNFLNHWGTGAVREAHGLKIVDDIAYTTDRTDSVAVAWTLDGKPLRVLGNRGVHSDTGCGPKSPYIVLRPGVPFNHPTEMMPHPNGDIYVTDGYRNCRVHRFTRDGQLVRSWGTPGKKPGEFHLPHSIAIDANGKLYIADRSNSRIQIFWPDGEFIGMWTDMTGPNDITLGKDGIFYIAEQEIGGPAPYVCMRDADGKVLARLECPRHIHGVGVDSRGDIYAGLTIAQHVDKFVRKG